MSDFIPTSVSTTRDDFDQLLGELRPKLHRYCARMTGSVIDGEDAAQEAIVKAIEAFPADGSIGSAESWLIRIAHNTALDFLRRRARQEAIRSDEEPDMIIDPIAAVNDRQIVAASLRTFMRLPVAQRSSVILMDVLGYSLDMRPDHAGRRVWFQHRYQERKCAQRISRHGALEQRRRAKAT
jgi:RNA polymerase sigma-70 factor (ECF subfamily)